MDRHLYGKLIMKRFLPGPTAVAALFAAALFPGQASAQVTNAATTNGSVVIATGNTFQTILSALGSPPSSRRSLTIQNNQTTTDNCWVFVGSGSATKATSILLPPGQAYDRYFPYGAVRCDVTVPTCAVFNLGHRHLCGHPIGSRWP